MLLQRLRVAGLVATRIQRVADYCPTTDGRLIEVAADDVWCLAQSWSGPSSANGPVSRAVGWLPGCFRGLRPRRVVRRQGSGPHPAAPPCRSTRKPSRKCSLVQPVDASYDGDLPLGELRAERPKSRSVRGLFVRAYFVCHLATVEKGRWPSWSGFDIVAQAPAMFRLVLFKKTYLPQLTSGDMRRTK